MLRGSLAPRGEIRSSGEDGVWHRDGDIDQESSSGYASGGED